MRSMPAGRERRSGAAAPREPRPRGQTLVRCAASGTFWGAAVGAVFGLCFGHPMVALIGLIYGLAFGAVSGAVSGVAVTAADRGRVSARVVGVRAAVIAGTVSLLGIGLLGLWDAVFVIPALVGAGVAGVVIPRVSTRAVPLDRLPLRLPID